MFAHFYVKWILKMCLKLCPGKTCLKSNKEVQYILVNDRGVGCAVLIDYRHHESDEFWPEVQVLDRWTLLLSGKILFPALNRKYSDDKVIIPYIGYIYRYPIYKYITEWKDKFIVFTTTFTCSVLKDFSMQLIKFVIC